MQSLKICSSDERRTDRLLPVRIVASQGVEHPENLLTNTMTQGTIGQTAVSTFSTKDGQKAYILLDYGAEIAGGIQLSVKESHTPGGDRMKIRFGESASEAMTDLGVKGSCCDHSNRDMDMVLPWYSSGCYGQTGFRFVYLELLTPESSLNLVSALANFTYRDLSYQGSFACSDPVLDEIYAVAARTVHLSMQEMLWDGIKRDRLVWIGDTHPEMLAIRSVFGDQRLIDDCLRFCAEQYPLPGWPNHMTSYAMWYILILADWTYYNGRTELVKELACYWEPLLEKLCLLVHTDKEKLLCEEEWSAGFFLDWPTRFTEDAEWAVMAVLLMALEAGERLAKFCENENLSGLCRQKAALLREVKPSASDKKQVTAMLVLAGLLSKEDAGPALSKGMGHGMSTFMSYYILKAVKQCCGMETALVMLREYYGGMLSVGATSFWEDFDLDWLQPGASIEELPGDGGYDIHGDNGRFCYEGFRHSLCHGWSAGPCAFLAEEAAGILCLEEGCKTMEVSPDLGFLEELTCSMPTPDGIVTVHAWKEDGKTVFSIQAPKSIRIVCDKARLRQN